MMASSHTAPTKRRVTAATAPRDRADDTAPAAPRQLPFTTAAMMPAAPADAAAVDPAPAAVRTFDEMPLHQALLRGIYSHGFERPSPIQQRAVVPLVRGGDVIGQAQSGTGKTGAFTIGLLQRVDWRHRRATQALVLAPTRELAQQTWETVCSIGTYLNDANDADPVPGAAAPSFCHLFVGGTRVVDDVRRLQAGTTTVAVGTPGRVADLIRRGALRTDGLRTIVLDEADEMLSQGFAEQVYEIFKFLPKDVQVALFSATMPDDVLELTKRFMRDPTRILVAKESLTLDGIKQFYVALEEEEKFGTLLDLYESISVAQSVVFTGSRRKVDWLARGLNDEQHTVSALHAEMARGEREKVMGAFRQGCSRVLVTTDLVARGIDVQHVNVVVNFDLPTNVESYLHRIGRSGRWGRKGIAINFVTPRDVATLRALEAHYHTLVDELPMDFAKHLSDSAAL